jgi:RNA polymerase sigma-70 factor (ECF subfamily)
MDIHDTKPRLQEENSLSNLENIYSEASEHIAISTGYEQRDLIALIPHMRAFARMLCRDRTQADDLTQDALASALKHRGGFTAGTNLKSWLFAIVRNQFYSDKRRSKWVAPLDPAMAEETLVARSNPMAALELEEVSAAMQQLCPEQREALILVAVAGLPYEEAAVVSGCAVGTTKSRVNRARLRLNTILSGASIPRAPTAGAATAWLFANADRLCARAAA